MSAPIIVWLRADLRIHDHPALASAIKDAREVIPVFILDDSILGGSMSSSNRNRFLLESLQDLRASLRSKGGDLVLRQGNPATELQLLAKETGAVSVYYTTDYSPLATRRDKQVARELEDADVAMKAFDAKLIVSDIGQLRTKSGSAYKVFTPFWNAWQKIGRRAVAPTPKTIHIPKTLKVGSLPALADVTQADELSKDTAPGGETEGRRRLKEFINHRIDSYHNENNDLGKDTTSRLSPYMHFGCVSVREIETMLPDTEGARAWHRQLAWRDFYYYVLLNFPYPHQEFQERYRTSKWAKDDMLLTAWKDGKTGYPVVDAAMRQLRHEGWMHNRARLIVGSFLTKDLGIDWREGEAHFMCWLLDGDMANNNGNWQWIASVGVDPAPVFRRLYNPSSQRDRYDPDGSYVRRYVPELKHVSDNYSSEPWKMPQSEQEAAGCIIGKDYPEPIVDHAAARQRALEWYKQAGS